jgi:hypothetical protein
MRKGFTRKPKADEPATQGKNYITPSGLERLKDEHQFLLTRERPAVTEVVAWANGDRSDNADYQLRQAAVAADRWADFGPDFGRTFPRTPEAIPGTDCAAHCGTIYIGRLSPAFPVTPPDMRVRIRRFGGLSYRRPVNFGIPSESK